MPPPVLPHDLFTTNRVPSTGEICVAKDLYDHANTKLRRVRQKIAELQLKEAKYLQSVEDLQPVFSPFRQLPYDIIAEILLACTDVYPMMHPGHAPLLFLQISRRIRQVAMSQPRLWSGILIQYEGRNSRLLELDQRNGTANATLFISTLMEWLLVRSGDVSLNIKVKGEMHVSSEDTMGDSILNVLYFCKRRWRSLSIGLRGSRCNDILEFSGVDYPRLQHLSFASSTACSALLTSDILHAPKLQGLKLRQYSLQRLLPIIPLPWSKLTFLDLTAFPTPVFPMLRDATSLTRLRLGYIDDEDIGTEPLNFPFLTSLKFSDAKDVEENEPAKTAALLELLNAPHLTSLTLNNEYAVGDNFPSIVKRFPRLVKLVINMVDMYSFREVLVHTPNLTTLRFCTSDDECDPVFTGVFLQSFISNNFGPRLCSKLEVFACGVELEPDEQTLRQFFRKKYGHIRGLAAWKSCTVTLSEDIDHKIKSLLNMLVTEAEFDYKLSDSDDEI